MIKGCKTPLNLAKTREKAYSVFVAGSMIPIKRFYIKTLTSIPKPDNFMKIYPYGNKYEN